MTPETTELAVYVSGTHCGTLREDRHRALSFEYAHGYDGVPLSLSMPVGLARYEDRVVRPYLEGLLPDDESTRTAIGAPYGISGNNPFRLLRIIGLDCPGAVQICPKDSRPPSESETKDLVELSEHEIAIRLANVRENAASAWTSVPENAEHWSLGGWQAKIALRKQGAHWFECLGAAATTHILKPGVADLDHQALVEYLSMKIAKEIGLPVAEVEYHLFEDEPAIIVERYDRSHDPRGQVQRIHQEDLCQALGVSPSLKYAEQGGPSTPQIVSLLRDTGTRSRENVYRFVLYLFFNYLIGATDAHAKNHSIVYWSKDDIRLAPLYDIASIAPYQSIRPRQRKPLRAALSIGGENRFGMVGEAQVEKMVASCKMDDLGLSAELLCDRFRTMASLLPDSVDVVVSRARDDRLEGIEAIGPTMCSEIRGNCERTLGLL